MWWALQLLTTYQLLPYVLAEANIIVERWFNASDVIKTVSFTTITTCYMGCMQTVDCAAVGFEMNPQKTKNKLCKSLKTKGAAKKKQNFISMFILLTVDDFEEELKEKRANETIQEKEMKTCKSSTLWKRIHLINKEQPITRNKLVTTLEKVTRQFVMHLDVKLTGNGSNMFCNIVHFTLGGNTNVYGDRAPAVYFVKTKKIIQVSSAVNGKIMYTSNMKARSFEEWNSIQVSQLKQKDGYNYSVTMNGKLGHSVINTVPTLFENMKVFASSNFIPQQPGFIKAFWMDIDQGTLWKRIHLINKEQPITRNKLVTTLEKVTRQFIMHLDVKLTGNGSNMFCNIVHFTLGGNTNVYGDRAPAVYFVKTKKIIQVSSAVNGKIMYTSNMKARSFEEWNSIQVSQLKQKDGYNYSVTMNGKLGHSVINTVPTIFENMKVFASSNFIPHQPGFIKALWMDIYQGEDEDNN